MPCVCVSRMQCIATCNAHKLPCLPKLTRCASWCTGDPGPPQAPSLGGASTELVAVPGLQRTTLGFALRAPRGCCAAPGTHISQALELQHSPAPSPRAEAPGEDPLLRMQA